MIDTRDLIMELRELCGGDEDNPDEEVTNEWDSDEFDRAAAIRELLDEIGEDAFYGVVLILEDDFTDYAQELAEDIGAIDIDASWPHTCIDWDKAADDLRNDYTCITFDGEDYLYRA